MSGENEEFCVLHLVLVLKSSLRKNKWGVCVCVCVCVNTYGGQRVASVQASSTLAQGLRSGTSPPLQGRVSHWPGAHRLGQDGWPACPGNPIFDSLELELLTHANMHGT